MLRTPVLVLILGLTGAATAVAAPVTGWAIVDSSTGGPTAKSLTGAATNSPVLGTGADGSATQLALFANISGAHDLAPDVSLADGQTVRLSGSVTIQGNTSVMEQFRFGLFNESTGTIDAKGWMGYLANNSAGGSGGALRAKDAAYADFPNQLFAATAASGSAATLGTSRDGGSFTAGVYDFAMSVTREGSAVVIDASLVRGTEFAQTWHDLATADPDLATFDFNRVGFLCANMSADAIAFNDIQVSTVAIPTLTLEVIAAGPYAGQSRLINSSSSDVTLDYYEIRSSSGKLNPNQWTSLADRFPNGWVEAGGVGEHILSEGNYDSSTTLAVGEAIPLGKITASNGVADLQWFHGGEELIEGLVSYTVAGDFNGDGVVSSNDLPIWREDFGSHRPFGDANYDAQANGEDFLIWQRQLGLSVSVAGARAVPEPHLAILAVIALTLRKRWFQQFSKPMRF